MNNLMRSNSTVILGAGLTGLTAAYALKQHKQSPLLLERDSQVGGLAKTIEYRGFRFDLGGHRFVSSNKALEFFVKQLLKNRYRIIPRSSKIYFNNKLINYPIEPIDIIHHFGPIKVASILIDYSIQKCRRVPPETHTLESWVVKRFGNKLYQLFFKQYSEKVWGINCNRIDSDWIAQRIQGLDLLQAIKYALCKSGSNSFRTLDEKFLYPIDGIGQIATNLSLRLNKQDLLCNTKISCIHHDNHRISSIEYLNNGQTFNINTRNVISTLPLTTLIKLLRPRVPRRILMAANSLRSRDLLLVFLMLDIDRATGENWIYFPQHNFPFGRIHEPKNWSPSLSPPGKTSLVVEYFCNRNDTVWNRCDKELINNSITNLNSVGIIGPKCVFDATVQRIPNAYPLFELGYRDHRNQLIQYLSRFINMSISGRSGSFQYNNMDRCMLDGFSSAEYVLGRKISIADISSTLATQETSSDAMRINHSRLAT